MQINFKQIVKNFQERVFQKRKFLVAILPIMFVVAILYPSKAYALPPLVAIAVSAAVTGVVTAVVGTATNALVKGLTFFALIQGIQAFALIFGNIYLKLGISILNWGVKGGPFAFWSMTNPANNRIIEIGWTLLRDLTNMFFILGLAYIGLATALNIANFNTKKTFFALLLMAVLINFTPVICGLIVDGTNIISNFFLSEVNFDKAADIYEKTTASDMETITPENLTALERVAKWVMLQFYSAIAGTVYIIFGFIFLFRTFIIWFLVILSPVAFFCRIFDFSKQWYTRWWSTFVGWSFVAIPAAFFLYLGNHLLVLTLSGQIITGMIGERNLLSRILSHIFPTALAANAAGTTNDLGFWGNLSPYFVSMLFLIVGFISTLKIKTAGAGFIMNIANKAVRIPGALASRAGAAAGEKVGKDMGDAAGGKFAAMGLRSMQRKKGGYLGSESGKAWAKKHWFRGGLAKANRYVFGKKDEYSEEEIAQEKHKTRTRRIVRGIMSIPTLGATHWGRGAEYQATAALREQIEKSQKNATPKDASIERMQADKNRFMPIAQRAQSVANMAESGDLHDIYNLDDETDFKTIKDAYNWAVANDPELAKKMRGIEIMDKKEQKEEKDENGKITKLGKAARDSLFKQIFNENKNKLSKEQMDRAGLLLSDDDKTAEKGFKGGSYTNEKGETINTGIAEATQKIKTEDGQEKFVDDEVEMLKRKMIYKGKAGDIVLMSKPDLLAMMESPEFQKYGNSAQVAKAAEIFAGETVDALQKGIDKIIKTDPSYYEEHNLKLHNYLKSTPSRTLGLNYEYETQEERKKKADTLNQKIEEIQDLEKQKNNIEDQIKDLENIAISHHDIYRRKQEMKKLQDEKNALDQKIQKAQDKKNELEKVIEEKRTATAHTTETKQEEKEKQPPAEKKQPGLIDQW